MNFFEIAAGFAWANGERAQRIATQRRCSFCEQAMVKAYHKKMLRGEVHRR